MRFGPFPTIAQYRRAGAYWWAASAMTSRRDVTIRVREAHLLVRALAVRLRGLVGDPEVGGDGLQRLAAPEPREDRALSRCEVLEREAQIITVASAPPALRAQGVMPTPGRAADSRTSAAQHDVDEASAPAGFRRVRAARRDGARPARRARCRRPRSRLR